MKAALLCDIVHRDFKSLALISYYLEKDFDITTHIIGINPNLVSEVKRLNVDVVCVPKLNFTPIYQLLFLLNGIRTAVIDVEGNIADEYVFKILAYPMAIFFWNKNNFRKYSDVLPSTTKKIVSGSQRLNFFHNALDQISDFESSYYYKKNLDKSFKIITVATASQDIHLNKKEIENKIKARSKVFKRGWNYSELIKYKRKLTEITKEIILNLSNDKDCIILIRPHPRERYEINWIEFIKKINKKNVYLTRDEPIDLFLKNSSLHLCFKGCQTSVEATLLNIPVAEIHTPHSEEIDNANNRDSIHADYVSSYKELEKLQLKKVPNKNLDEKNLEIIQEKFGNIDENINYNIAKELNELLIKTTKFDAFRLGIISLLKNSLYFIPRLIKFFFKLKSQIKDYSKMDLFDYANEKNDFVLIKRIFRYGRFKKQSEYNYIKEKYYKEFEKLNLKNALLKEKL